MKCARSGCCLLEELLRIVRIVSVAPMDGSSRLPRSLLILLSALMLFHGIPALALQIDYGPYRHAVESGDQQAALAEGRKVYTRLAFQAGGTGIYYSTGLRLACIQESTDSLCSMLEAACKDPKQAVPVAAMESLWVAMNRLLTHEKDLSLPDSEEGRFLQAYLLLCQDSSAGRILAVIAHAPTGRPEIVSAAATALAFNLSLADSHAFAQQPSIQQAIDWIVRSHQARFVMDWSLAHDSRPLACAVSKAWLTASPGDLAPRKQFVDFVSSLCKARRTQEALELCTWAQEATNDPSFGSVLVLQQAVIAGRDQKDYALAVDLCDKVAAASGEANTAIMARYMAGRFCLDQANYQEVIRRMDELTKSDGLPPGYRLKGYALWATALVKSGKHEEAVAMLSDTLGSLAEPEPVEAVDCRQILWQTLLSLQRYDEAAQQCRLLLARHPGHPAGKAAAELLDRLNKKTDAATPVAGSQ